MGENVENVCIVRMISHQIMQDYPELLVKETSKDPFRTQVLHYVHRKVGQTNCQMNSRSIRNWITRYALNMAAYSLGEGL